MEPEDETRGPLLEQRHEDIGDELRNLDGVQNDVDTNEEQTSNEAGNENQPFLPQPHQDEDGGRERQITDRRREYFECNFIYNYVNLMLPGKNNLPEETDPFTEREACCMISYCLYCCPLIFIEFGIGILGNLIQDILTFMINVDSKNWWYIYGLEYFNWWQINFGFATMIVLSVVITIIAAGRCCSLMILISLWNDEGSTRGSTNTTQRFCFTGIIFPFFSMIMYSVVIGFSIAAIFSLEDLNPSTEIFFDEENGEDGNVVVVQVMYWATYVYIVMCLVLSGVYLIRLILNFFPCVVTFFVSVCQCCFLTFKPKERGGRNRNEIGENNVMV